MKLISLNTWGGKAYDPLMDFIQRESPSTDVFCFQEIFTTAAAVETTRGGRARLYDELAALLPGFDRSFVSEIENFDTEGPVDFPLSFGQATFTKRASVRVESSEGGAICDNAHAKQYNAGGAAICSRIAAGGREFFICNVHGTSEPGNKLDTPERLRQSAILKQMLDAADCPKIICGDFNLLPGTRSLAIAGEGMRNLIAEYKIPRTRSRLSPWWGKPDFQKFADYALVSPGVDVVRFEVPDIDVSDHLPMVLEFE